jgi:hypothetical protein
VKRVLAVTKVEASVRNRASTKQTWLKHMLIGVEAKLLMIIELHNDTS